MDASKSKRLSNSDAQLYASSPFAAQRSLSVQDGTYMPYAAQDQDLTNDGFTSDYAQPNSDLLLDQSAEFFNLDGVGAGSGDVTTDNFDPSQYQSFLNGIERYPNYGAVDQSQMQDASTPYGLLPSATILTGSHNDSNSSLGHHGLSSSSQLLSTDSIQPSHIQSPRHSPSPQNGGLRSRAVSESLDPSSAAFPQGMAQGEWATGAAFTGHRRKPSDAHSDRSSHSNTASPYLTQSDSFEQTSPFLRTQRDSQLFNDSLGLNRFTISDSIGAGDYMNSMNNSPNLLTEQQPLPAFSSNDNYGLGTNMNPQFSQEMGGFEGYNNMDVLNSGSFPTLAIDSSVTEGQADAMAPPEINIDFAPPSRQPSFGARRQRAGSHNELVPPEAVGRKRAKSDPHTSGRSQVLQSRGRSPSLQPVGNGRTPSPARMPLPASRSVSPAARSASSASDSRQYLLDLADPDRTAAGAGGDQKRQKHPANFSCHLCPKKFTRAYNLRSHLRTHTDERPYVCTVCGKAFARQHDRKRHEGLHSGEKKFVCRGALNIGKQWGCGRRFARADALGRHFRSEAGRECIKPLLDEEAEERRKAWLEEQQQQQMQSQQGFVAPNPITEMPQMGPQLPAVLLQMYPDLAGFDFGAAVPGQSMGSIDEGSRSSYDASSGGEYMDDYDMSDTDPPGNFDQGQQQQGQGFSTGGQMGY